MVKKHKFTHEQVKKVYAQEVKKGVFDPETGLNTLIYSLTEKLPNYKNFEIWEVAKKNLLDDTTKTRYVAIPTNRNRTPLEGKTLSDLQRVVTSNLVPSNLTGPVNISTLPEDYLYHFTEQSHYRSILKQGLIPQIVRSGIGPSYPVIWFNVEESFLQSDSNLKYLRVPVNVLNFGALESVGGGILYRKKIPPQHIEIFNELLDEWEPLKGS